MTGIALALLIPAALLAWLFWPRSNEKTALDEITATDTGNEELLDAEQEVRDLDADIDPDDVDDELPDWGPGVPRDR